MDATPLYDNIHLDYLNNSQVQINMEELVNSAPNNLISSSNSSVEKKSKYQVASSYFSGHNIAQSLDIEIISPKEGKTFQYMENINISISGNQSIDNLNIAIGGTPFNPNFSKSIKGNSAIVDYTIDSKELGVLPIVVYGVGGKNFGQKTTYINVTTSSVPTAIIPSDKRMTIRMGKLKQPQFKGIFPDIGKVFIEKDTNTIFNFKNGYAEHLGKGVIRGINPGTDTLTVIFNGVESEPMKIIVKESSVKSLNKKLKNENLSMNLEVFPSSSTDFVIAKSYLNKPTNAEFFISDITGKIVQNKNVRLDEGENMTRLNLRNLQKGMYLISLKAGYGSDSKEIIKN